MPAKTDFGFKPVVYPVHELFYTWQGEGVHMGKPAFFIRLFGCPVHCPWCDSAGTWHKDYIPAEINRLAAGLLAAEAASSGAKIVVVTGGEPAVHNLVALTGALHGNGQKIHLETSGGFEIKGSVDWITLSPKRWKMPLPANVRIADEFKLIIEKPEDIEFYWSYIWAAGFNDSRPVWLHPEWSQRSNPVILNAISDAVKKNDRPFRAGWQMHKNYQVDSLDKRSKPLVPLGGDPTKGF
jgi:7-carboxy-7-deazaguanine synthase